MLISDITINHLRRIHKTAMMDDCQIMAYQSTDVDQYNQPVDQWNEWQSIVCKFRWLSSQEVEASAVNAVAEVETEKDIQLDPRHRLRLTKIHGEQYIASPAFEVASGPVEHYIGIVYQLRYVNDGSG